ncbi:MAG: Glycosyltransferase, group 1 [uncultured bacterium]|uniref:UDP-alpha-N-acetylglucosamine 3-alpha-N-acetyl-L-fucosaminyltransferase, putative n=1 Tax=Citrifermentans bemidjiense (strain ATCC BAA-1014 / DSM 16622 / JCM 12645 / Bem) TaxID=404380 RepID=B5E8Q7_CITBB|nr:glycosyltransferase family 4 protein [Citrifermentans bemidjiense]ACH38642.1 UDP-alpha-N-acetylglucosamine 3-alpha-N-acetyl-L-fucosaminyltransferase, putative [Citrifermentans bemidjiense Bem]EKD59434.1 MAG: Glycosyltransferase, group 1 [uncultured bacterium]
MHVLVVTQYFWPENFKINDVVKGLVERGHKVTVLTALPNYPDGSFFKGYRFWGPWSDEYDGARVVRVPILPRGRASGARLALNYLSFVLAASILGPLRCRDRYDVAFIFEPSPVTVALPALFMKRLRGIPVLFWVQDLWPESLAAAGAVVPPFILGAVGKLVSFIYEGCDRILVTSRAFVGPVLQYVVDRGQVRYFPQYGEDAYAVVNLAGDAPERGKIPEGFVVMFAGNIGAAQDFETILGAAQRLRNHKDIHFVIIGDGRMRKWVDEEVAKMELQETFHLLGRYPLEAMAGFFSLADAMLVTLKKEPIFSLTIPAKIQSYLACGRPIVAALDGEGARVIEEAAAGFCCPTEDPSALANAILKMRHTPLEQRRGMGERGLRYYNENFDRTILLDRLEAWMEELRAVDNRDVVQ